jgi:PBP1b-binding outer membrane lipoprotein LpoB
MTSRTALFSAAAVMALVLAGCSSAIVEPSASPTPTPTATAVPPEYFPDGDAQDNKAFFDWVLLPVASADQKNASRAMVNALERAGFSKKKMQVTPHLTKTNLEADSVIVSVEIKRSCLIGQRSANGEYFSTIETALKTGGCLIGSTLDIDW